MPKESFIIPTTVPELVDRLVSDAERRVMSFELELTARCNNNCRHCYINLPAGDRKAREKELSLDEIGRLADEAVDLGALWCVITGGEPLLREDFAEAYLLLKKKGLLVSVFTNACLITHEHIELFKKYPLRDMEVTVYGVTRETYEKVSRKAGSYRAFRRGLDLLLQNGIKVRLKAMALRSNFQELPAIAEFCRLHTRDYFRFDPQLHLRYDGNGRRNREIIAERLTPAEIASIEQADPERSNAIQRNCDQFIFPGPEHHDCEHLFHCGTGNTSFTISPEGYFRLCSSLWHPDCVLDLRKNSLADAWNKLAPRVRSLTSSDPEFLLKCRNCRIVNLCLWCPAHAYLEHGRLDAWCEYFCQVAHARAAAIEQKKSV